MLQLKKIGQSIEAHHRWLAGLFFGLYLIVGLFIYDDFGVHMDENIHRLFGNAWGGYVTRAVTTGEMPVVNDHIREIPEAERSKVQRNKWISHNLSHGPFWELVLYYSQQVFLPPQADVRHILLFRHLANFLLFYSATLIFYRMCAENFHSWKLGLLASLFLILHPLIFASSFYNTLDLPFLSFYLISTCTLLRFLKYQNIPAALCHAAACAMLVDIRAAGLLMPSFTLLFLLFHVPKIPAAHRWRVLYPASVYVVSFIFFMILFWPFLWRDSWAHFVEAVQAGMFQDVFEKDTSPWHNILAIMGTTPPLYLALFAAGMAGVALDLFVSSRRKTSEYATTVIAGILFILPIAATALAGTSLIVTGQWRHHYFVYPAFVVVCIYGVLTLSRGLIRLRSGFIRGFAQLVFCLLLLMGLGEMVRFMVASHPFQFAYTNDFLVREDKYVHDVGTVSYRQLLEYILAHDGRSRISVFFLNFRNYSQHSMNMLSGDERKRLIVVDDKEKANYLIGRYRLPHSVDIAGAKPVYVIQVGDVPITAVYSMPGISPPFIIDAPGSIH